jgi:peptide/nickel transport system permease protein
MTTYIIRRILYIIPTLLGITLVTFVIMQLAPGDPAKLQMSGGVLDEKASKEIYESMRRAYGLDLPKVLNFDVLSVESNIEELKRVFPLEGADGRETGEITTRLKKANVAALEALRREIDDPANGDPLRNHFANVFIYITSLGVAYDEPFDAKVRQIHSWWDVNGPENIFDSVDRVWMIFTKSQYPMWLVHALTLDFGESYHDKRDVFEKILERLPATVQLNFIAMVLAMVVAIPLGLLAAVKQGGPFDKISGFVLYILYSLPNFWIALLLMFLFSVKLGWLPLTGIKSFGYEELDLGGKIWDRALHLVLPVTCMTYVSLAYDSRFTRGSLLEIIRQDYIRTARAKGLSERVVIVRHALRNALIPLITLFTFILPFLIGGSVIIEMIFSWPGTGLLLFQSILMRDYNVVMGISFLSATLILASMLIADILYAVVDPRVTYD